MKSKIINILKENMLKYTSLFSALLIFVIILGIFISLLLESHIAYNKFGITDFIFSTTWDYDNEIFGAGRALLGTIFTALTAVIIAAPMGIGIAVFIVEICPGFLKGIISASIELLAAVPSIIYGMWGLFVFAPFIENTIQKWISLYLSNIPFLDKIFQVNYPGGIGLFTSGVVLSIMILPFIASISREALTRVPVELKESCCGIGAEKWETIRDISLPYTKKAITGGVIIALGRALGETMAIAYIIGNMNIPLTSIFDPYITITSVLVNEFNEASHIQLSSLYYMALLLFIINFLTLTAAKLYINRGR